MSKSSVDKIGEVLDKWKQLWLLAQQSTYVKFSLLK